ncbi:MAG: orotidine-5'-phosphate decarboxylase [Halanaerobiales bacterium]
METINIADRLLDKIDEKENPAIVGLDPILDNIPGFLKKRIADYDDSFKGVRDTIIEFNKMIIDQVADLIPAVKPQMAYYEQYGSEGVRAFEKTVSYAREKGLIVIEDAKRNDIGSTALAYSAGHLGRVSLGNGESIPSYDVDYLTITPYLGSDGIEPFINKCQGNSKGVFILVKTSNPSSGELQDKIVDSGKKVYELMAEYVADVGKPLAGKRGYSAVGAVVGATYPGEAEKLRKIMKKNIFLVPGYGAQGGGGEDVVPCFNNDGHGAVINSSRGILYAYNREPYNTKYSPEQFHFAAREAVVDMKNDIVRALKQADKLPSGWLN